MILKALYDYYQRCTTLPRRGLESKEIGFLIVIDKQGNFLRFEDRRIDKKSASQFLVKKSVGRSSAPVANFLYDNCAYVLGYSEKGETISSKCFKVFKAKVEEIYQTFPDNEEIKAVMSFYQKDMSQIIETVSKDPLWEDITKNLNKKFSLFSFLIQGQKEIIASNQELIGAFTAETTEKGNGICLVTGNRSSTVEITTSTMIPGSQATAKLVSFQVKSGYDSYGKEKGDNAPISEEAEFAYTTAMNHMLRSDSHNKFSIGNRTFLFWASANNEASMKVEESIYELFGFSEDNNDDPNAKIEEVRKVFESVYSGALKCNLDNRFYILGLAPNSARIAVVYWSETSLKDFAFKILRHFDDMNLGKTKRPYAGLRDMLASVTLSKNHRDATPNLPDAIVKSIFQGLPYPYTLFSSAIKRIRAEQETMFYGGPCRIAILKAYLNRLINSNNKKIEIMLDKDNNNHGYLCGRLFATLERIQESANNIHTIRDRYMNSASSTPSAVFSTLLNLSVHHVEKLSLGHQVYFEKLKQEIIGRLVDFPTHLDLQDQGRFFIGYYQQRQEFFTSKEAKEVGVDVQNGISE